MQQTVIKCPQKKKKFSSFKSNKKSSLKKKTLLTAWLKLGRWYKECISQNVWGSSLTTLFKCHIDHLVNKQSIFKKYVVLFYKIRHFPPLSALFMLYKTLFEPQLNYCNVIWCNTFTSHLKKTWILAKESHMGSVLVRENSPHPPSILSLWVIKTKWVKWIS